jgi:hypothetical protein
MPQNTKKARDRIFYRRIEHWQIWKDLYGLLWSPFAIVAFALSVYFVCVFAYR